MAKTFLQYSLRTDVTEESVPKDKLDKLNDDIPKKIGMFNPLYGMTNIGLMEQYGVDYFAMEGKIIGNGNKECKGILETLKREIKDSFGNCKKIDEVFIGTGNYIGR